MSNSSPIDAPGSFLPRVAVSFGAAGDSATAVDPTHPLPVAAMGATVSYVDLSAAIVAGGTAQQLAAARPARQGFFLQNLSTADLWLTTGGVAVAGQPAIRIAAGQLYEAPSHGVPGTSISVLGATTGQSFAAREW